MKKIKLLFASPLLTLAVLPTVASCSKSNIQWAASSKDIELIAKENNEYVTEDANKFVIKFADSIKFKASEKELYKVILSYIWTGGSTNVSSLTFNQELIVENEMVTGVKATLNVIPPGVLPGEFNSIIKVLVEIKNDDKLVTTDQIDGIKLIFNPTK